MPKRISQVQNEKILLLNNLYGDIYDYSQTIYNGYDKSITIIDKQTQISFTQNFSQHLKGSIPSDINYHFINYIKKCDLKYDKRYKYSNYKGYNKSVDIYDTILDKHFTQNAQCHYEDGPNLDKKTLKDFEYFKEQLKDKYNKYNFKYINYDWSNRLVHFDYQNITYSQNIYEHLKGLPKTLKLKLYFDDFVVKANKLHNNEYEYSDFINSNEPITVKNKKTGKIYQQRIKDILKNCKPKQECTVYTFEKFVEVCNKLHNNAFEYSNYTNINNKVDILHKDTGISYTMYACNHMKGSVPKELSLKNISKHELKIIKELQILYPNLEIINSYRPKWLERKELDIYIPDLNLAIEFNGLHYHHSDKNPSRKSLEKYYKDELYHYNKSKKCLENNVNLIHIFDFEYIEKSFNLKNLIDKYLNRIELIDNKEFYVDERTFQIKSIKDSSCLSIFVPQIKICEVA